MPQEIAYINGRFCPPREAMVSIEDRGFHFSDGIYEVVAAHHGRPFRLPQHMARLRESVRGLDLPFDPDAYGLERVIHEGLARSGFDHTLVYLQITRGVFPRQHVCQVALEPTVVATFKPMPPVPAERIEKGVSVKTAEDIRWGKCYIKAISLLPNVLIKNQAVREGFFDALLVTSSGDVRESCSSNVFLVKDGVVRTPPADEHILHGITRGFILECAAELGLPTRETRIPEPELFTADEVFFTATTYNVMPITRINNRPIANGRPGPMTRQLYEYAAQVIDELSRVAAVA
jgi:D-alanine transaminase